MRSSLPAVVVFFSFAGGAVFLQGQTAAPAPTPPASHDTAVLSFLTTDQQVQYAKAHAKALADNPDLKVEGDEIKKEVMASGAQANQAIIEKMNTHRQKLRQAMLTEDPTLKPIFAEIDKHISEAKARQAGAAQSPAPGSAVSSH